jgi:fatty acid amide hydrolase
LLANSCWQIVVLGGPMDEATDRELTVVSADPDKVCVALVQRTASQLAKMVRRREVSAVEVTQTHIASIEERDSTINAIPVRLFASALDQARDVDRRIAQGEDVGALAGVPITVKECFDVAGHPTTVGLTHRNTPAAHNAWAVDAVGAAGGVVVGKTNVPQLMLMYETDNPLYGQTVNPWNHARVVGGSSGGEAAALAAGFSALGIGTDLGGSIRVPASMCGVCGFKPTSHRLSRLGAARNFRGMEAFGFQPGPMARSVGDLRLAMKVLSTHLPLDPELPPVSEDWSEHEVRGLRVATLAPDSLFPRHPVVDRALRRAETALRDRGVVVEQVEFPFAEEAFEIYVRLLAADAGHDVRQLSKGSRLAPQVRKMILAAQVPFWARPAMAAVLRAIGKADEAKFLITAVGVSASGYWKTVERLQKLTADFYDWMRRGNWDAWLAPAHRLPAFRHGQSLDLLAGATDAFFPNLLGAPAGVVPITRVAEEEKVRLDDQVGHRRKVLIRADHKVAGLPVGIQVAALRWQDNRVLNLLAAIESHVKRDDSFPSTPCGFS